MFEGVARESALSVDVRAWPLVRIRHLGEPSDAEVDAHLQEIESRILSRGEAFGMVIDQARAQRPTPIQREMIAEHQERNAGAYGRLCQGEAYVCPDPAMRGGMIAVFWRCAPEYPYTFVDSDAEAESWVRERLFRTG